MKKEIILDMVERSKGKFFTVTFIKKDGNIRTMNCRTNVQKYTNGKGLKFDPIKKNLLPVYDLQAKGYRFVNILTILDIHILKEEITFNNTETN